MDSLNETKINCIETLQSCSVILMKENEGEWTNNIYYLLVDIYSKSQKAVQ